MLLARIICSDPGCYEEIEVPIDDLDELEGFTCECGHGFVLATVSELAEPAGEVVSIAVRRPQRRAERRAA
ncbi:MAG: hypothetical protein ACXWFN_07660 [Solirubrobacterales bacterium]